MGIQLLISAQVMISGSRDKAPHWGENLYFNNVSIWLFNVRVTELMDFRAGTGLKKCHDHPKKN